MTDNDEEDRAQAEFYAAIQDAIADYLEATIPGPSTPGTAGSVETVVFEKRIEEAQEMLRYAAHHPREFIPRVHDITEVLRHIKGTKQ